MVEARAHVEVWRHGRRITCATLVAGEELVVREHPLEPRVVVEQSGRVYVCVPSQGRTELQDGWRGTVVLEGSGGAYRSGSLRIVVQHLGGPAKRRPPVALALLASFALHAAWLLVMHAWPSAPRTSRAAVPVEQLLNTSKVFVSRGDAIAAIPPHGARCWGPQLDFVEPRPAWTADAAYEAWDPLPDAETAASELGARMNECVEVARGYAPRLDGIVTMQIVKRPDGMLVSRVAIPQTTIGDASLRCCMREAQKLYRPPFEARSLTYVVSINRYGVSIRNLRLSL